MIQELCIGAMNPLVAAHVNWRLSNPGPPFYNGGYEYDGGCEAKWFMLSIGPWRRLRLINEWQKVAAHDTRGPVPNAQSGDSMPAPPGRVGRYYLRERINSGGMADIWVASDSDGKHYALRLMHPQYRLSFFAKRRFLRGCDILARLSDHEQIIGYVEHGKIHGQPYLVMEYVEASNLKELQAKRDSVLVDNVAQILIDMAAGLEHIHENGYMHLDFKPENVLVTRNAGVRLVDFDLARPIPEKSIRIRKNPGTPAYMAPEQLLREPIGHRVDIFAFGVAAYELLTSQKPFPGDTPTEILSRQLNRMSFVTPREHNPDIPANAEKVILKCLERDPERRYPFVSVMAAELRAALYV